jgi:hypothetical protein
MTPTLEDLISFQCLALACAQCMLITKRGNYMAKTIGNLTIKALILSWKP